VESPDGKVPRNSSAGDTTPQRGPSPSADRRERASVDALSAMTPRFNLPVRWFASRFFRHFDLDDATVEHLRKLESRGSIIYVMRYASRLDYFLFNALFIREGLGLSKFANGIRFYYYRPLWQAIRLVWRRRGEWLREPGPEFSQAKLRAKILKGESSFLFLRTARFCAPRACGGGCEPDVARSNTARVNSIFSRRPSGRSGIPIGRFTWFRLRSSGEGARGSNSVFSISVTDRARGHRIS